MEGFGEPGGDGLAADNSKYESSRRHYTSTAFIFAINIVNAQRIPDRCNPNPCK